MKAPLLPLAVLFACTGDETTDKNTVPDTDADTDADSDADTDADTDADSDTDTDTDTTPIGWSHTVAVNGDVSEWTADEWFAASSGRVGLTWDADELFVAIDHPDVGSDALHWVVVTLGDGAGGGATSGISHGAQTPALSFGATAVLRFKADGSYQSLLEWNGSAWTETPGFLGTDGSALALDLGAHHAELSVPFARLGLGTSFDVHVNWVYEGGGSESSYGPVPTDSFVDGFDPDYTHWYSFARDLTTPPTDYASSSAGHTGHTGDPAHTAHTGHTGVAAHTGHTGAATTAADTGLVVPWSFTPTLDGDASEWPADTAFTTSAGTTVHFGWDADHVYAAITHADVATGTAQHWVELISGSGGPGSTTGPTLGTQTPALPFPADQALRRKLDGSYDDVASWNGAAWVPVAYDLGTTGVVVESGTTVELSYPRASLGLGSTWNVVELLVYEGLGSESTYAASPSAAIADGAYDPAVGQYWSFDLLGTSPPTTATPQ